MKRPYTNTLNKPQFNWSPHFLRQWVILGLTLLMFGSLIAFSQWIEYKQLENRELERITAQAEVLKKNIEAPLLLINRTIDGVLKNIEFSLTSHSILNILNNRHLLAMNSASMGTIQSVSVVDANGIVQYSSDELFVGTSLAEQEYFKAAIQFKNPGVLHISTPYQVPGQSTHAISLFKNIFDQNGNFAGAVVITLVPEYFSTLLSSVHYSPDIRSSIVHSDGVLFQMVPESVAQSGSDLSTFDTFFSRHKSSGQQANVYSGKSKTTAENRIVALRTVLIDGIAIDKPLVVTVSRNINTAIIESWRRSAYPQGILFAIITILSVLVLVLIQRWRRTVHAERQKDALALERANRALLTLSACNKALVRNTNESDLLSAICRLITEKGHYRMAWVGVPDNNPDKTFRPVAHYGYEDGYLQEMKFSWTLDHGPISQAMHTGEIQINLNFQTDPAMLPWRNAAHKRNYQASIALPLRSASGILGVLSIYTSEPVAFDVAECKLLQELADNLAFGMLALQNHNERNRAQVQLNIAAVAFESQEGIMITDSNQIILNVNQSFTEITGYQADEVIGQKSNILKSGRHDAVFYQTIQTSILKSSSWQGEIWNKRKNGEHYLEWLIITAVKDEAGQSTHFVGSFTDITQRKQSEEKIHQLAFYDTLTNLPNRQLLFVEIQTALTMSSQDKNYGVLLLINLDNFMTLNDTLGHEIGDLLLQQVAARLIAGIRDGATVARLGGDEFVVMIKGLGENLQDAIDLAEKEGENIIDELSQKYQLADYSYQCSCCIGLTVFSGHQQDTVSELLTSVDLALYQAKEAGRNTLRFFAPQMKENVRARASLVADLREGIEKDQFLLYYQAQFDDIGNLIGAEALLRWQCPKRGLVPPSEFIPIAEDMGLILPLGNLVLQTACTQLAIWANQPEMTHLTLSVNVSAYQFHQESFVSSVIQILERTGANPERLELELTESLLVNDVEGTIKKMLFLRNQGVSFALDDFGTGYSSLSILKQLPLNRLKIDRSFVLETPTNASACTIAQTIIALGKNLGLIIIAEGVETKEQFDFLAKSGCDAYQGYLFSRPVPLDEFIKCMS